MSSLAHVKCSTILYPVTLLGPVAESSKQSQTQLPDMAEETSHGNGPFTTPLRPPAKESLTERAARALREFKAKRTSDAIDMELMKEKTRREWERKHFLKAVLIGESDSGKSDFIKSFRMKWGQEEVDSELAKWKCVIQLKILEAVVIILDAVQSEINGEDLDESLDNDHSNGETEYLFNKASSRGSAPLSELVRLPSGIDTQAGEDRRAQERTYVNG
ncbi:hypothetical protein EST38_g744 [Candolleomyces aberdarensis]|uniref:Uncharacterized protein n=1 Tax=Candolleomyces aberdarensis TaxID=2316362 RepID=A0A4Q2DWQ8_9AGAR|nr:hypothetical protein EST38_g744 [Candolleomyces aberdarensis]